MSRQSTFGYCAPARPQASRWRTWSCLRSWVRCARARMACQRPSRFSSGNMTQHGGFPCPFPRLTPRLQLARNLHNDIPPLRLRSQHERLCQRRLDHIQQLIFASRRLRRFRPNPTSNRALGCTTRAGTRRPFVSNRALSPPNRAHLPSRLVFDSRRSTTIVVAPMRDGLPARQEWIAPVRGRGSAPPPTQQFEPSSSTSSSRAAPCGPVS